MAVCLEGLAVEHPIDGVPLGCIATVTGKGVVLVVIIVRSLFFAGLVYRDSAIQIMAD